MNVFLKKVKTNNLYSLLPIGYFVIGGGGQMLRPRKKKKLIGDL